jgi:hypothetical protein
VRHPIPDQPPRRVFVTTQYSLSDQVGTRGASMISFIKGNIDRGKRTFGEQVSTLLLP